MGKAVVQKRCRLVLFSIFFPHPILVLVLLCLALRAERPEIFPVLQLIEFRSALVPGLFVARNNQLYSLLTEEGVH